MLFNSLQFAVFFLATWCAVRSAPRGLRAAILLGASLLFYTLWYPVYLLLLLGAIGLNYALLRAICGSDHRRKALWASIAATLGLLASFKYAGFLAASLSPALESLTGTALDVPELFLPLGISFYSFQMIGLAIDSYRNPGPAPSLQRYALFVSFFPQLIAGPILRGHELMPQIATGGETSPARTRRGLWLLASGLVKKVVLADFLLSGFVQSVYAEPDLASAPFHLVALYSFAFQIYFDFSGYTDMARGLALLLGFELPLNFREPYLARNPSEFWRRWHITLSQWLRDYLYIPLGGNRRGAGRTYCNLLVTMLLGGLWHGAGWNFVIWGAIHGLLLAGHRLLGGGRKVGGDDAPLGWRDVPKIALLFHATCFAWIFFRAESFEDARQIVTILATADYAAAWPLIQVAIVALCALLHPLERWLRTTLPRWQLACARRPWSATLEGAALGLVVALAVLCSGTGQAFIYFQF